MARPIVVSFILLQNAAEQHAARNEQKVCGDNNHNHGHEEPYHRVERIGDAHGEVVRGGEDHKARQTERPVCLRRLFADGLAAQHRYGAAAPDTDDRGEPDDRKDDGVKPERARHGIGVDADAVIDLAAEHIEKAKLRELGEKDAERKAEYKRERRGNKALPGGDARKIPLAHAEDVIEAELLRPAADQKRVRIIEENGRKHENDRAAEIEDQSGAIGTARQQRARLR